jgi:hypothetical protein
MLLTQVKDTFSKGRCYINITRYAIGPLPIDTCTRFSRITTYDGFKCCT